MNSKGVQARHSVVYKQFPRVHTHTHIPVKQVQRPQAEVPEPGLHLDVVEQLRPSGEKVAKDRPEGGAGCLAMEPSYSSIDATLGESAQQRCVNIVNRPFTIVM